MVFSVSSFTQQLFAKDIKYSIHYMHCMRRNNNVFYLLHHPLELKALLFPPLPHDLLQSTLSCCLPLAATK